MQVVDEGAHTGVLSHVDVDEDEQVGAPERGGDRDGKDGSIVLSFHARKSGMKPMPTPARIAAAHA